MCEGVIQVFWFNLFKNVVYIYKRWEKQHILAMERLNP
jgi:hypothetical protein